MKKYELVLVVDAALSSSDVDDIKKETESLVTVLETDDMGLLPTAYPIRGQDQAYYVSYYIEADNDQIVEAKKKLKLRNGLARYVFFAMKDNEEFLNYADLKKKYMDIKEAREAALQQGSSSDEDEESEEGEKEEKDDKDDKEAA